MDFNSPWFSLGPLIAFNVVALSTALIFRSIYRRRQRVQEVEERHASKVLNRWLREYWYWITDPFVRFFIFLKLSPNALTFIGVLISAVSGAFFATGHIGLGGWFLIFGGTFDTFDGRVARATNRETKSGAYFDAVMDRASEGVVFLGLILLYRNHWGLWIVVAALLASYLVSYTKAKGEAAGADFSGGIMQRPERVAYLGMGGIFSPMFVWPFVSTTTGFVELVAISRLLYLFPVGFVAIMSLWTAITRIRAYMRLIDELYPLQTRDRFVPPRGSAAGNRQAGQGA